MAREDKKHIVATLRESFTNPDNVIVIVIHYHGLTVDKITALRREIRSVGASFIVGKNSLVKIALQGTGFEDLSSLLKGPTAITFANDPVSASKIIAKCSRENESFNIIGAVMDNKLISKEIVHDLATLPSMNELRARLVGLVNAPTTKIIRVLNAYVEAE
jgi:large subunit ribosomal protein L10